jgi:hypothetical protein
MECQLTLVQPMKGGWFMKLTDGTHIASVGLCCLSFSWLAGCRGGVTDVNTLTQHGNAQRWGENLAETHLTPANVNPFTFGLLYVRNVDGDTNGQVLYMKNVPTKKFGSKNLFLVTTDKNMVYAFDIDDTSSEPSTPALFNAQLEPTALAPFANCETPSGRVGIASTPVIDPDTYTMYVVARNSDNNNYYLQALDITDNFTVRQRVAVGGGFLNNLFRPECERNRPALLLQEGTVYVGLGSFSCDACMGGGDQDYQGWIFGYKASDLAVPPRSFCTGCVVGSPGENPPQAQSGVWQSGNGLVGDGHFVYFETGNGQLNDGAAPFADSFVRLDPSTWTATKFTPSNKDRLNNGDADLGSGGPVFLSPNLLLGGGKQGKYYVLDAGTMQLSQDQPTPAGNDDGFQAFYNTWHLKSIDNPMECALIGGPQGCKIDPTTPCYVLPENYDFGEKCGPNIHAGPVVWTEADPDFSLIYQMAEKEYVRAFRYDKSTHHVDENVFLQGSVRPQDGMPGGFSTLSANFDRDAILWVNYPLEDAQAGYHPGRLAAFDARTLRALWASDDVNAPLFAKFIPPTVADGRVILPTWSNKMLVYGWVTPPWWRRLFFWRTMEPKFQTVLRAREREALQEKFELLGGGQGILGEASSEPRQLESGGWAQDFKGIVLGVASSSVSVNSDPKIPPVTCSRQQLKGTSFAASIYWTSRTGAHVVMGDIRDLWLKLGGPRNLGYPTSDERITPDGLGRISHFEHGDITWTPKLGALVSSATGETSAAGNP